MSSNNPSTSMAAPPVTHLTLITPGQPRTWRERALLQQTREDKLIQNELADKALLARDNNTVVTQNLAVAHAESVARLDAISTAERPPAQQALVAETIRQLQANDAAHTVALARGHSEQQIRLALSVPSVPEEQPIQVKGFGIVSMGGKK